MVCFWDLAEAERVGWGGGGGGEVIKMKKKENEKNTWKSTTIQHCMGISNISTYKFWMHRISCGCLYFFLDTAFLVALSPVRSSCHNSESNFWFEKMAMSKQI